jgi:hypothetical protein
MQHFPEARTPPPAGAGLEALRGPRVRLRLAASVGADLIVDGRLRPAVDLKQDGQRGRALCYNLVEAGGRRLDPAGLNAIDAERVDLAVVDGAFAALGPAVPGERLPLLSLPVGWSTLRAEKARRRLLRRVAAGQVEHGAAAVCEVIGLEPGVPRAQVREVVASLHTVFRGVLVRTLPTPGRVRPLEGCGFTGATVEAGRPEDEAALKPRVAMLQAVGPITLIHGVRTLAGLAAGRAAGAGWASLDIQPGGEALMAETKTAAGSPRPLQYVLVD